MPDARKPLISGNWKMHNTHFEAIQLVQKLSYSLEAEDYRLVDVSIHPPFTDLRSIQTLLDADDIPMFLGAQNCHWEDKGAYTGEVAAPMLAKLAVRYVIAGHSERRQIFGETDDDVNKKVRAILRHEMTPILAVGETLEEREAGDTEAKLKHQVEAGLAGVTSAAVAGMVIAYEPIWAIGTGRTAGTDDAQAMCAHIRGAVERLSGADAASRVRIQYGGSVKATNINPLMAQPDIDGALVGGASLEPESFARIVQYRLQA